MSLVNIIRTAIIGGGGHSRSVLNALFASRGEFHYWIVDDRFEVGSLRWGVPVVDKSDIESGMDAFVAIGDNAEREKYSGMKLNFINVVHPSASIMLSRPSEMGTFYGAYCYVGPGTEVGKFCIINTGAILEHDSELGDFSHLCPGVVTGGRVKIGHHTTIGLGAMIRDGVTIGNYCTIGMGSVVTRDIPDNSTAWGNPCTIKRHLSIK